MSANPRNIPYLWVTHLTGLLSGDQSCEWARWFTAHYQGFEKMPRTFDNASWKTKHTALVNEIRARMEADGALAVYTEDQNAFQFDGRSATVGGKPDLVGQNAELYYTVRDAKTGSQKDLDIVQVQIYIWLLPLSVGRFKGAVIDGWVDYPNGKSIYVPTASVTPEFIAQAVDLIKRLAAATPARKVPSAGECKWCDLTTADCPERVEAEARTVTDLW